MDFDMNAYIVKVLKPLRVPVFFVAGKENNFPFVVFNVTSERGEYYWEDEEQVTEYRVTLNIFAKGNYTKIKKDIERLLLQAGFGRYDIPACIYLEDIEVYNQPMEFVYKHEIN